MVRLTGQRVHLRDWRAEDLPVVREWLRPEHDWHRWDGPYFPRPTDEDADRHCEALATEISQGMWPTPRRRLVVASPDDDRLLGSVSWYWESRETDWRRIGIVLYDPTSWSGGRGTEAVALWTSYLFTVTRIVRLDFATWSGNVGMCRIGAKLGWTEEGRFRDARVVEGSHYDSVVYGVLRSEWTGD